MTHSHCGNLSGLSRNQKRSTMERFLVGLNQLRVIFMRSFYGVLLCL